MIFSGRAQYSPIWLPSAQNDKIMLLGSLRFSIFWSTLQHFSYFLLSSLHRFFISVFVWFLCSWRFCTDELETLHVDWTNVLCIPRQTEGRGLWPRKIDLSPPPPPPPLPTPNHQHRNNENHVQTWGFTGCWTWFDLKSIETDRSLFT